MECHAISTLLKEQQDRTIAGRIAYFEVIPDLKSDNGEDVTTAVLSFVDEGSVMSTGFVVIKGKDAEAEAVLQADLEKAHKENSIVNMRITAPASNAGYTNPEIWAVPVPEPEVPAAAEEEATS